MLKYNCYVVDDEADSIEILQDYIAQTPNLRLVYATTNPRDFLSSITEQGKPKITFLDIEMPGISGLEVADIIRSHSAVVFITSHAEHAADAFETDAYDFLVKPISYPRFLKAVIKVQERLRNGLGAATQEESYFFIRGTKQGQLIKIYFADVLYIESLQNYVKLHTVHTTYITYLTLKEFELKLNRPNFFKVHKSYVINLDRIAGLINNELTMEDNAVIPVGASHRQSLQLHLKNKTFSTDRKKDPDH